MMLAVTYDVNTETEEGAKRLWKVAKLCERYGIHVRNSVIEVLVDASQFIVLKTGLVEIIDKVWDSVRFYRLGNSYQQKMQL